jgi:hypothetical protein
MGVTVTFLLNTESGSEKLSAVNVQINADAALKLCSNLLRAIDGSLGTNARVGQQLRHRCRTLNLKIFWSGLDASPRGSTSKGRGLNGAL